MFCWRWFRDARSWSRSGGAFDVERAEAASVTGVSLARWLRRGRWNRQGVFDGAERKRGRTPMLVRIAMAYPSRASVVLVELLIASRCLLHCPLRSTGQWRRQRRPWWCQRLTGGAPVGPPRRIRRGA